MSHFERLLHTTGHKYKAKCQTWRTDIWSNVSMYDGTYIEQENIVQNPGWLMDALNQ